MSGKDRCKTYLRSPSQIPFKDFYSRFKHSLFSHTDAYLNGNARLLLLFLKASDMYSTQHLHAIYRTVVRCSVWSKDRLKCMYLRS